MEQDIKSLLEAASKELSTILSSNTVVGAPMELHGRTIIPLLSVGFGSGLGAGKGADPKKGEGGGSGVACAGGVRPVALLISDKDGVRVEPIKSGAASAAERVAETVGNMIARRDAQTAAKTAAE